ncbi:50S ribosomal protein L11 methyltransferase [Petrocella sp. FN5]|uniref:50S ribosomal protein L11 methyltransferase n=1 Tax=Petrocella sp. FN5 TaxID=3032002 RepID=UPI0023DC5802|nr:50S ribosomal protein L11 methyltransferase [Petrocella sp. FN5]MDF1618451.1 50S ribosomal protein L11 methyltransferase [Petrocella sp. FN5]
MKWTKLKIHVLPLAVDAASNMLFDLGLEGLEIEDQYLSESDKEAMFANFVADTLVPLEECRLVVYLDENQDVDLCRTDIEKGLNNLRAFLEIGSGKIILETMPDEDYENKWKTFYKPFRVGDHMVITPIWEKPDLIEGDMVIAIDPGMAFGSGTHETTYLCIELLQECNHALGEVADIGCGSGILAIAAVRLGAKSAIGVDIDENAVKTAKENVKHNALEDRVTICKGNLLERIQSPVNTVVANILAEVIIDITKDVKKILHSSGILIASGILIEKEKEVTDALVTEGFTIVDIRKKGEWVAIKARL